MLFTRAAEFLTEALGPPTRVVETPTREWVWVLRRVGGNIESVRATLKDADAGEPLRVEIWDAFAPSEQREEHVTILDEADFSLAVALVRARTGG